MSQQPERVPPLVTERLPVMDQVTLYFRYLKTKHAQVRQLVYRATKRANGGEGGYADCDLEMQNEILAAAARHFLDINNAWKWTPENIGRYIASGLTQITDLDMAIGLMDEDVKNIKDGPKDFPPDHAARTKVSSIYEAAKDRVFANHLAFVQKVEPEDRIRQGEQAMQGLSPLSPGEIANHTYLMGVAAKEIQGKKK